MRRLALIALGLGSPALLTAGWMGASGAALYALLAVVFPVALATLGAESGRPAPRSRLVLGILLALLVGSTAALLAADGGAGAATPLLLALGGLWLLPLAIVGLGYGWSFAEHGPTDEGLERVRGAAARRDEPRG